MRLDKLLWFLRLAKTRAVAQSLAQAGHIRVNGQRVERAHRNIASGDVLTLPRGASTLVIEIVALPARRGPAPEARACYRTLDEGAGLTLAAPENHVTAEGDLQP